ncbi:hypothetical protein [Flavobacterium sp. JP2137]|uniref:hypothetical protein n=1 Tax=Flavobacterium sp. JP2137 TaxID=3414510 RepID=UPI003D300D81
MKNLTYLILIITVLGCRSSDNNSSKIPLATKFFWTCNIDLTATIYPSPSGFPKSDTKTVEHCDKTVEEIAAFINETIKTEQARLEEHTLTT